MRLVKPIRLGAIMFNYNIRLCARCIVKWVINIGKEIIFKYANIIPHTTIAYKMVLKLIMTRYYVCV